MPISFSVCCEIKHTQKIPSYSTNTKRLESDRKRQHPMVKDKRKETGTTTTWKYSDNCFYLPATKSITMQYRKYDDKSMDLLTQWLLFMCSLASNLQEKKTQNIVLFIEFIESINHLLDSRVNLIHFPIKSSKWI